jgi:hypothetical protein
MKTELFILKKYKYFPTQFTHDVDYFTPLIESNWSFGVNKDSEQFMVITTIGVVNKNKINLSLYPLNLLPNSNPWELDLHIEFLDDGISNSITIETGSRTWVYTKSDYKTINLNSAAASDLIEFTATTPVRIYLVQSKPTSFIHEKIDLPMSESIKITKSLKDLREPFSNGNLYSKEFYLPIQNDISDVFGFAHSDDSYKSESYKTIYDAKIDFNSVSTLFGNIILSKITKINNIDYYSLLFTSQEKKFFDLASKQKMYLVGNTETLDNQHASNINSALTGAFTSRVLTDSITYGFFERGEDLESLLTKPALTQQLPVKGKVGMMADSFTPAIWNRYMFDKVHDLFGYTISGDILDDDAFNNLVLPLARKNWYEKEDFIDVDDLAFNGWFLDMVPLSTGNLFYENFTNETDLMNPLSSSQQVDGGKFSTGGGTGFSRYTGSFGLGTVRQEFDFTDFFINIIYSHDTGYYAPNPMFKLKLYVAQQYDTYDVSAFEHILLDEVEVDVSRNSNIFFDVRNTNKLTTHYYKADSADRTYFYVTYEYYSDSGGEQYSNFEVTFEAKSNGNGNGIKTKTLTDTQGDYKNLRFDRFFGNQVGAFQLPKEKTVASYLQDLISMFNLVVEIDENLKTISYNKWEGSDVIQNLSKQLIRNKKIEKNLLSSITPDIYSFKFNQDDTDWLTFNYNQDHFIENLTELTNQYGSSTDNIQELVIDSNFYLDSEFSIGGETIGILNNSLSFTDEEVAGSSPEKSNRINYTWDQNLYAFANFIDNQGYSSFNIHDEDLTTEYTIDGIPAFSYVFNTEVIQSFKDINNDLSITTPSVTLFDNYWSKIISQVSGANQFIYTAYFYIDVVLFNKLNFNDNIRIDNQLFYINKIYDWAPNLPTKIELIKIWRKK